MTPNQKKEYERKARDTVSKAGLELIAITPEEDYIETWCPNCKKTSIFRARELGKARCLTCAGKRNKEYFERRSEELIELAGFTIRYMSYEEDYIEVECPDCEKTTSFHFEELDHIFCKPCLIKRIANKNGFDLYWEEDVYGAPWEDQLNAWKETNLGEPVILACRDCGTIHILCADLSNITEAIQNNRCRCAMLTPEINQQLASRGFFAEAHNSPLSEYTLQNGEFFACCERCGNEIVLAINDENLMERITTLVCNSEDCGEEADPLYQTRCGEMAWCYDALRVISIMDLTAFNVFAFDNGEHLRIPEGAEKEVYYASDPEDQKYAFAFVVFPNEADSCLSKYLLFRFEVESWGNAQMDITLNARWPHYYEMLHVAIKEDINNGTNRRANVAIKTYDSYIAAYNAEHSLNSVAWGMADIIVSLEKIGDKLRRLVDDESARGESRDPHLKRWLNAHVCPVCGKAYTSKERVCLHCGFPELNRVFVNKEEAKYWETHVLLPYKTTYANRK